MKEVITLVGARPQFVKAAVVSKAIADCSGVTETIVHSGQHYDLNMSAIFFDELGLAAPKTSLNVGGGSHGYQTGATLQKFEEVLLERCPDGVLVYGDTNTTLAGVLAAVKLHIPVAHVEAGLRSFNRKMPEEVNRIVADSVSDLLFTPTDLATENLQNENVDPAKVYQVGDVMQDAAQVFGDSAQASPILEQLGVDAGNYVLATVHRSENTDDLAKLKVIVEALVQLSALETVVLPLHPRTRKEVEAAGLLERLSAKVNVVEPQGYIAMLALERDARLVLTDSGGVQKEAYFQRVPCVTLREETEWIELLNSGWNRLAPPSSVDEVVAICQSALGSVGDDVELYGAGDASRKIASVLAQSL